MLEEDLVRRYVRETLNELKLKGRRGWLGTLWDVFLKRAGIEDLQRSLRGYPSLSEENLSEISKKIQKISIWMDQNRDKLDENKIEQIYNKLVKKVEEEPRFDVKNFITSIEKDLRAQQSIPTISDKETQSDSETMH